MKRIDIIRQCREDIASLTGALRATKERAADIIIDELKYRGSVTAKAEDNVLVIVSKGNKLDPFSDKEFIKVTDVILTGPGDDAVIIGTPSGDELNGKSGKKTVSVYDIDNPERILILLEEDLV